MTCKWCIDGWLIASRRGDFEEWGPCPKCPAGKLLEFPMPDDKGRTRMGPWGIGGYWQGREELVMQLRPMHSETKPLPHSENARRSKELFERLRGVGKEMAA